jgi:small subunit ribosomal protein S17
MKFKKTFGYVIRTNMKKTIVVLLSISKKHSRYQKRLNRNRFVLVHDEMNKCRCGDFIHIKLIKPISKLKHYIICQN